MLVAALEEVDPAALVDTEVVGFVAELLVGLMVTDVPADLLEPLFEARLDDPAETLALCLTRFLARRRR